MRLYTFNAKRTGATISFTCTSNESRQRAIRWWRERGYWVGGESTLEPLRRDGDYVTYGEATEQETEQ